MPSTKPRRPTRRQLLSRSLAVFAGLAAPAAARRAVAAMPSQPEQPGRSTNLSAGGSVPQSPGTRNPGISEIPVDLPGGQRLASKFLAELTGRRHAAPLCWQADRTRLVARAGDLWIETEAAGDARSWTYVGDPDASEGLVLAHENGRIRRVTLTTPGRVATPGVATYDTLRVRPDGVELTFSSELALRYTATHWIPGGALPPVYQDLLDALPPVEVA